MNFQKSNGNGNNGNKVKVNKTYAVSKKLVKN